MKKHYRCYRYPLGVTYGKEIYGSYLVEHDDVALKANSEFVAEFDVESIDATPQKELTEKMAEELFPIRFPVPIENLVAGVIIQSAYDDYGIWPQMLLIREIETIDYETPGFKACSGIRLKCIDLATLGNDCAEGYELIERINPADEYDLEFCEVAHFKNPEEPLCWWLRKPKFIHTEIDEEAGLPILPRDDDWKDDRLI